MRVLIILLATFLFAPPAMLVAMRFIPAPVTSLMLIRRAEGYPIRKQWRTLDEIGSVMPEAVVASEDQAFCAEKWGFDVRAIQTDVDALQRGKRHPKGASTIAMQTARNLFLWPGRGFLRKGLEAFLTVQIAILWPKRRLLEIYLHVIEFGPGIYGAEQAAQYYFHKPAAGLSLVEAGQLVAIMPDPLHWHAMPPSEYVSQRAAEIADMVIKREADLGCVVPSRARGSD